MAHGQAETRRMADVVVLGGGLSGVAAALAARAAGRQVLLVTSAPALADEVTVALHGLGAPEELRTRVAAAGGEHDGWLDPAITEMEADRLCAERGIDVLLYTTPLRFVLRDGEAAGVLTASKAGLEVIAGAAFVDATADGALLRAAGAEFALSATVRAARSVYFQFAGEELSGLPESVDGFSLAARVTWPGEVCVTLTGEADYDGLPVPAALLTRSRLAVSRVALAAIAAVPGLAAAAVSHTGHRLLPLSGPTLAAGDGLPNVFGAGPWVAGHGWGDASALVESGTLAGSAAAACHRDVRPVATVIEAEVESTTVAVAGGGTGGAFAALASARLGAPTVLLEAGWFLGGIGTGGGIHYYYHGVRGGLQENLDADVRALADDLGGHTKVNGFSPEAKKIALERALAAAGVDVRYETIVVDATVADGRLTSVLAARTGRLVRLELAAAVDGSGDGDLAALAGAAFTLGRPTDGVCHAYTQSRGQLEGGKISFTNFDAGYVDATDPEDLTRARRFGVQVFRRESYTAENRALYLAPLLGVRQSRQVLADYVLTLADQTRGESFDDAIAYGSCHYDNHAIDVENESDEARFWVWNLGFWSRHMKHGLPYRSLLPTGVEGLLMGSRAVGVSHDAHMLFRMQRDMQRIGEASGTAAALAVQAGVTPRALGAGPVQQALHKTGGWLPDWRSEVAVGTVEELVAQLAGDDPRTAAWQLYQQGVGASAALRQALASGPAQVRWWAASVLAMLGDAAGVEVLREALLTRDGSYPVPADQVGKTQRVAPHWKAAIGLLGQLGDQESVPALAAVLTDPGNDADALIAAIRALGRIGDIAAVEPLLACAREVAAGRGVPGSSFQVSMGGGNPIVRDVLWQARAALADALAQLGQPQPQLVEAYLHDERAWVRAEAERLVAQTLAPRQAGAHAATTVRVTG